ncbi:hypothetical protein Golomagni_03734 [Golovinomyces magnicellulatus]|nr:hypothetical protein Golomagni_03734 [Golovinomyces magnicellulatus]
MENDSPPSNLYNIEENNEVPVVSIKSGRKKQYDQTLTQKRALARVTKKSEFLLNLIANLDTLIYVELCVIYYMEQVGPIESICSLFRLILRLLNQMIFFTPKPAFVPPVHQPRPYIGAIFIPCIICILLHVFTARSESGEAMRGYLHGGIIIDLIGQKGPTSKIHLVLLDLLLLALQCFMLAVRVEEDRLQTIVLALSKPGTAIAGLTVTQDYDAEERGVIRDEVRVDDVELDNPARPSSLSKSNAGPMLEREIERQVQEDDETLELFWSGMATVCDFHILHNLRKQRQDFGIATSSPLQTVEYSVEFPALTANHRVNATTEQLQRDVSLNT